MFSWANPRSELQKLQMYSRVTPDAWWWSRTSAGRIFLQMGQVGIW